MFGIVSHLRSTIRRRDRSFGIYLWPSLKKCRRGRLTRDMSQLTLQCSQARTFHTRQNLNTTHNSSSTAHTFHYLKQHRDNMNLYIHIYLMCCLGSCGYRMKRMCPKCRAHFNKSHERGHQCWVSCSLCNESRTRRNGSRSQTFPRRITLG